MGAPETTLRGLEIDDPVVVEGTSRLTLTKDRIADFDPDTRTVTVVCASGERYTSAWTGIPVADILETAEVPPGTTHVAVESIDEYRVTIPIADALVGLLAYFRDGTPVGTGNPYANRLVSSATEGARDIKGVSRIEAMSLDPSDDPDSFENLFPDGERFTPHRFEKEEPDTDES